MEACPNTLAAGRADSARLDAAVRQTAMRLAPLTPAACIVNIAGDQMGAMISINNVRQLPFRNLYLAQLNFAQHENFWMTSACDEHFQASIYLISMQSWSCMSPSLGIDAMPMHA